MDTPPSTNQGTQIIAFVPTPTQGEFAVVGRQTHNGRETYVTWLWHPNGQFYWGRYDFTSANEAVFDMLTRADVRSDYLRQYEERTVNA